MKENAIFYTLDGKPKRKKVLGRSMFRWDDNIKVSLKMCLEGVVWVYLRQNKIHLLIIMDTVMKFRVL
jgi:hypothetical protein